MDPAILSSTITLGTLGLLFGGGLAYASRKFAVEKDPRLAKIIDILPGANCGGCGYPGCNTFAEAFLDRLSEKCRDRGSSTLTRDVRSWKYVSS